MGRCWIALFTDGLYKHRRWIWPKFSSFFLPSPALPHSFCTQFIWLDFHRRSRLKAFQCFLLRGIPENRFILKNYRAKIKVRVGATIRVDFVIVQWKLWEGVGTLARARSRPRQSIAAETAVASHPAAATAFSPWLAPGDASTVRSVLSPSSPCMFIHLLDQWHSKSAL